MCINCSKLNHDDDHCFIYIHRDYLYCRRRKPQKAKIVELKQRFKIVASLGQVNDSSMICHDDIDTLILDIYMFGALGKMIKTIATHAETSAKVVTPFVDESKNIKHNCYNGSLDHICQTLLPLSFGLVDIVFALQPHVLGLAPYGRAIVWDLGHTLVYKMLQVLIFSSIDLLAQTNKGLLFGRQDVQR